MSQRVIPVDAEAVRVAVELLSHEDEMDVRATSLPSGEWREMLHAALYRALASR